PSLALDTPAVADPDRMPRSSALQLWELEGLGFEAAESSYRVRPRTRPNEEAKPGRKASPRVRTIETQPCERSSSLRKQIAILRRRSEYLGLAHFGSLLSASAPRAAFRTVAVLAVAAGGRIDNCIQEKNRIASLLGKE